MVAINKANSGHPGIVLGAAPMMHALYTNHLNIDVKNPKWINRDRFVLSAGHGSILQYAINHLSGFKISLEDIKNFRQPGNTPGHPEYGHTDGIEVTSGPLGQGIANAVGMAIAEAHLAAKFNKDGINIIDHNTYALLGDGDLQEGVAMEAMSLAGHLGLNKLIVLFDSNDIQLDGAVNLAFSENHELKMKSIGWNYLKVEDGNDLDKINSAIKRAKKQKDKPSFIEIKTVIGYGASDQGTSKVHGAPLGLEETEKLRKTLNWNYGLFEVPEDVYEYYKKTVFNRGKRNSKKWSKLYSEYKTNFPKQYEELEKYYKDVNVDLDNFKEIVTNKDDATRNVSGKIINKLSQIYPNLIGGSADLTASTKAKGSDGDFSKEHREGRNINIGVREHAMGAIINGIVLHGGLKSFGGAFFVFSDYMKPAIRLAALMNIPSIFVFSHDSIAVGEDGPTHQPIEQLVGLRAIPNLNVIRPADARETMFAWKTAIESKGSPTVIVLTRQTVNNSFETDIT
jgi:transketolase